MAEVSFLHFPEEENEDLVLDEIITLDCPCYPLSSDRNSGNPRSGGPTITTNTTGDRKNQVNFVMDLFHQRVEQSHDVLGTDVFVSEPVNESSFGVIEDNYDLGLNCLDVELGLELGLGLRSGVPSVDVDEDCFNFGGFVMSDCGDEFFVARRESNGNGNDENNGRIGGSCSRISGLRVVGLESDSEEEEEEECNDLLGIDLHSEEEDFGVENVNDIDDIGIPLCWESFQLEEHGEGHNDFEWEEVDGRVVDEREVLSIVNDPDEDGSISVLPISGPEDDGIGERGRGLGNLEWEVLLNVNNLERNPEVENDAGAFVDHDDYFYTAEYEMMFGQFADGENAFLSRPAASKSVVEKLPSVVMTEEDVRNERTMCAVCKDNIGVGEEGKQLPCSHRYHGDCIIPWLGIRNTCPVCRHELPTDDPDYEHRRIRRGARAP